MIHFINSLLSLLFLKGAAHSVLAHQTLPRRALDTSVAAYPDTHPPSASSQAYDSSQVTGTFKTLGVPSHILVDIPTPMPSPFQGGLIDSVNYENIKSGYCAIDDKYCSFEGSAGIGNSSTKVFTDQCLLWDTSCSGNRTLAIDEFFNSTLELLQGNLCFVQFSSGEANISIPVEDSQSGLGRNDVVPSDCEIYNPPERISEWQDIKEWMRSSECVSAQREWIKMGGEDLAVPSEVTESCCGLCELGVDTVDLYYWPEPDVNQSCLNIVGTNVNPFTYGATTGGMGDLGDSEIGTYWACSAKAPATSTYTRPGTSPGSTETIKSVRSIVATAMITTIGSLPIKVSLFNPWSSSPCIDPDTSPRDSNGSISSADPDIRHSIQARAHNITVQSSNSHDNSSVSTVVSGNFTLLVPRLRVHVSQTLINCATSTSPSVYANFRRVEAGDRCGQTTMISTMLSFSPGELSSIEGPLVAYTSRHQLNAQAVSKTKQFNFRDLPCPPQSIMVNTNDQLWVFFG